MLSSGLKKMRAPLPASSTGTPNGTPAALPAVGPLIRSTQKRSVSFWSGSCAAETGPIARSGTSTACVEPGLPTSSESGLSRLLNAKRKVRSSSASPSLSMWTS